MAVTLKYSIAYIPAGAIARGSVGRIKITENVSGSVSLFVAPATFIGMNVVGGSDYRFSFVSQDYRNTVVIPVSQLNDIGGVAPVRNDAKHDLNMIITLINP